MRECKSVFFADNQEIVLHDKQDISLSWVVDGKTVYNLPITYPVAGYGGGSLSLSPSKEFLLFPSYSGQSEEAFLLFKIANCKLELLYETDYVYGECAEYIFSDDEVLLFQILRTGWWYSDEAETDSVGKCFYKFGEINILNIRNKTFDKHIIYVYPSKDWKEEVTDIGLFEFSKTINADTLSMTFPWGKKDFTFPLEKIIKIYF